ncbi:Smc5-Smc6 complex subunit KRE29 LALA0_S06e07712g [Lachancea lanzarotensis]|uniref:LALA0S06e07712g1_1 n=1 Tax=Lachancea lanzarotensis TaxID=1245769 RepID=A0A0C7N8U2_9SACH|nr:uncharacterized protein LALA0_S06e07712g [Lachancea lanzarotensis]CEP62954.1 LALA0S06e07712g1_1 [Lachancea lanzarotensis]
MGDRPNLDPSESPVNYSDYYSAASTVDDKTCEPELVADSQDSDDILSSKKHSLNDIVCLSDSLESDPDSEDPLQDIGIPLGTGGLRQSPKPSDELRFVEFDTSERAFDENIVARLNKFEELSKIIEPDVVEPKESEDASRQTSKFLMSIFKQNVPRAYVEMVVAESSGQRFRDWHFISEDATVRRPDPWDVFLNPSANIHNKSLNDLLRSFGVVNFMSENTERIKTSMYDTMNRLESVAWMCKELENYVNSSGFTRTFIRFVLDRNIFESAECITSWCSTIYAKLSEVHFLNIYFELVDREEYMLHLRISQQIPEFRKPLIDELFPNADWETIIKFCATIPSSKNYLQMVYFVLLVYGTDIFPPARSENSKQLRKRIQDLCEDTDHPELMLLQSYVNLFTI